MKFTDAFFVVHLYSVARLFGRAHVVECCTTNLFEFKCHFTFNVPVNTRLFFGIHFVVLSLHPNPIKTNSILFR